MNLKLGLTVLGGVLAVLVFGSIYLGVNTSTPVVMISSCSMYPRFSPGDAVIVGQASFGQLETGETVVFRHPEGGLVAHQVIYMNETSLGAKGVNNYVQQRYEKNVKPRQVVGDVFLRIPLGSLQGNTCIDN